MKHLFIGSIIFSAGILATAVSHAGSANATFDCKSASGRTVLKASVPGDHAEHTIDFTIDGENMRWKDVIGDKNSSIHVLGTMNTKNYHFLLTAPDGGNADPVEVFRFSAMPSSIKVKRTANGERGKLSGVVIGQDPRAEKNGQTSPKIVVDCSYSYEI